MGVSYENPHRNHIIFLSNVGGDNVINLGIGIGSLYGVGTGYSTTIPPVSVSFERGFFEEQVLVLGESMGVDSSDMQENNESIDLLLEL